MGRKRKIPKESKSLKYMYFIKVNLHNEDTLKFGISNNKDIDTKDYVLGKFNDNDVLKISNMSDKFISLLNDYLVFDFDKECNSFKNSLGIK